MLIAFNNKYHNITHCIFERKNTSIALKIKEDKNKHKVGNYLNLETSREILVNLFVPIE
jgi:hypothetical protein